MGDSVLAWHWHKRSELRDGSPLPPLGEMLTHHGPVSMCASGLHASRDILDAFRFAPAPYLSRVECQNVVHSDNVKFVCTKRKRLWTVDASEAIRKFVRQCALDVIDKWKDPKPSLVIEYLNTGNDTITDVRRIIRRRFRGLGPDVPYRLALKSAERAIKTWSCELNKPKLGDLHCAINLSASAIDKDELDPRTYADARKEQNKAFYSMVCDLDRESV